MNSKERLTSLFAIWIARHDQNQTRPDPDPASYAERCADMLIQLDAETDGHKLFQNPQAT